MLVPYVNILLQICFYLTQLSLDKDSYDPAADDIWFFK